MLTALDAFADTAALYHVTDSAAAFKSSSSPTSYLRNIEVVLCPLLFMAKDPPSLSKIGVLFTVTTPPLMAMLLPCRG